MGVVVVQNNAVTNMIQIRVGVFTFVPGKPMLKFRYLNVSFSLFFDKVLIGTGDRKIIISFVLAEQTESSLIMKGFWPILNPSISKLLGRLKN